MKNLISFSLKEFLLYIVGYIRLCRTSQSLTLIDSEENSEKIAQR